MPSRIPFTIYKLLNHSSIQIINGNLHSGLRRQYVFKNSGRIKWIWIILFQTDPIWDGYFDICRYIRRWSVCNNKQSFFNTGYWNIATRKKMDSWTKFQKTLLHHRPDKYRGNPFATDSKYRKYLTF